MTTSQIPPSPSHSDYTQREDYAAQMAGNSAPIFDRDDPIALFEDWLAEARRAELNDSNAMALATVDASGLPDVRMVLLKGVSPQGFVFYTNGQSHKGMQLAENDQAALCFHWKSLRRQVRVRGQAKPVSDAEADAYFASRARGSQIGAWASDQSRTAASRELIERRAAEIEEKYEGQDIPRPPHWHGWRIAPISIEFWRDRPFRLHDRLVFLNPSADNDWEKVRYYP